MLAQHGQLAKIVARFLARQHRIEQPMDRQVGIAADRRGEVAIAFAGQGIMPLFRRTVDRALQAPQHRVVDGVLVRLARDQAQQLLQLEPAFQAVGRQAQAADEFGQGLQLARVGGLMHAPQEMQIGLGQQLGHGLVGRQHELFDDLMALGVHHQVRAVHLAVDVEIDLHLAHRKLERPAPQPPLAQDHGQLVHPGQQRVYLGVELRLARLRGRPGIRRLLRR